MTTAPRPPRSAAEASAREVRSRHADPTLGLAEIAARLGHSAPVIESTASGAKYFGTCSCGYRCTNRRTPELVVEALVHHVKKAVRAWHATGAPLPEMPAAGVDDKRPAHLAEKRSEKGPARLPGNVRATG